MVLYWDFLRVKLVSLLNQNIYPFIHGYFTSYGTKDLTEEMNQELCIQMTHSQNGRFLNFQSFNVVKESFPAALI